MYSHYCDHSEIDLLYKLVYNTNLYPHFKGNCTESMCNRSGKPLLIMEYSFPAFPHSNQNINNISPKALFIK